MTNFEYMKKKIVDTVMGLDEMELLRLAEDAEMTISNVEGIFNCTVCEDTYGECDDCPCTSEHNKRYLDWCRQEHVNQDKTHKTDKEEIAVFIGNLLLGITCPYLFLLSDNPLKTLCRLEGKVDKNKDLEV